MRDGLPEPRIWSSDRARANSSCGAQRNPGVPLGSCDISAARRPTAARVHEQSLVTAIRVCVQPETPATRPDRLARRRIDHMMRVAARTAPDAMSPVPA